MPLKNRKILPPGGYHFYEARTGWSPMAMLDFETTVNLIVEHRKANPRFAGQWATDRASVAEELDLQTCRQLASRGLAEEWCQEGGGFSFQEGPAPKQQWLGRKLRESAAAVKNIVAGIGALTDWLGDGAEPVESSEAENRASICFGCPNNRPGTLGDFFTTEASEMIRKQLSVKADMKLATSKDNSLGVCGACLCPLKLKVWAPIEYIRKHTSDEVKSKLATNCWIRE
jgi:hypothetical protein